MKNNRLTSFFGILFVSLLMVAQLSSCKDEYTNDSRQLQFSTDTIAFDTIFSEVLTPTQIIKVYNFTEENILIESISLLSEYQCFQINVNGMSGKYFDNQEIKSGDSLFIFAQAIPAKTGENLPLQIEGKIEFKYNNRVQQIVMSAFGQDVYWCKKLIINQNTIWDNTKPYLIYDSLIVEDGVMLEVLEGTYIYMHHDATIVVNGNIKAKGSFKSSNEGSYVVKTLTYVLVIEDEKNEDKDGGFFNNPEFRASFDKAVIVINKFVIPGIYIALGIIILVKGILLCKRITNNLNGYKYCHYYQRSYCHNGYKMYHYYQQLYHHN